MRTAAYIILLIVAAPLGSAATVEQQSAKNDGTRQMPLAEVQRKATKLRTGDQLAIRQFVDEVFDDSILIAAPESVRQRVARAEADFLAGKHPAVTEAGLVEAINRMTKEWPETQGLHLETNVAQVHSFRQMLRQLVPSAIGRAKGSFEMSPAEAALVTATLVKQKLINSDYQVPADEWVRSLSGGRATHSPDAASKSEPVVRLTMQSGSLGHDVFRWLNETPRSEKSELTLGLHRFLNRLNIAR